ncbi:uncharacterized protein A1O9_02532 [Exophiala aquamarina CBS 119918]|uniref:Transcription factor domain-containing protein n=1 Tax=Exophiala aquamarina CBS 119918 TaxID=1182545 RepID=A0A072PNQ1_9EURO|nr:uncharacterized protein A1O9_02532 [Exophiala aquamarina CBS 119918]KEF60968.1 hypothetical protein A1O9_02532 [Exophiala aquamarina CBS 119918]
MAVFLQDYCVASKDPSISRGYLSSLQSMLLAGSSKSNLAEATRLGALASLGNKLGNPDITRRACLSYPELLRSFQATISRATAISTVESLTIVVLLGLYEMISATADQFGGHRTHFIGLSAILSSRSSDDEYPPTVMVCKTRAPNLSITSLSEISIWPHDISISCNPGADNPTNSLDVLLLGFGPFFRQNQDLLTDTLVPPERLLQAREFAISMYEEFASWPSTLPQEWTPKTIGYLNGTERKEKALGSFALPSRIDIYFDLFVCVVWNAYRKCRILLLNFISTCTSRLCDDDEFPQVSHSYSQKNLNKEVRELSEAIAASIPFLIYQNPDALLVQSPVHGGMTSKQETLLPGSAHGGLLLMHILVVQEEFQWIFGRDR